MSRWADSTDDDDDYLNEGDHEDYIEHAVGADEVSAPKNPAIIQNMDWFHPRRNYLEDQISPMPCLLFIICIRPAENTLSFGGCVTIVKNTYHPIFVIPGLTRNPVSFQADAQLDAGSGLSSN